MVTGCMMMMQASARATAAAWIPPSHVLRRGVLVSHFTTRRKAGSGGIEIDEEGRRIRRRRGSSSPPPEPSGGGWDGFDPFDSGSAPPSVKPRSNRNSDVSRGKPRSRSRNEGYGGGNRSRDGPSHGGGGNTRRQRGQRGQRGLEKGAQDRKINLKALEGAGFVHLYGLASCLNALKANRRDFVRPEDIIDLEMLPPKDLEHEMMQRERKPEAQYSPWLFVQQRFASSRSNDKAMAAQELERLAKERNIPIANVDKGVLNTLCQNRPHQGYVLRCGKLTFEPLSRIPHPDFDEDAPNLWLVLDEVVDPQNLGALLRSAYFLGSTKIGVLVCAKNSAPPSPVVSAASAGALELLQVHATSNLPRALAQAEEDGFCILGAAAEAPLQSDAAVHDLQSLQVDKDRPTLLVLGSEGHGLRNLVAKACTEFVRIPPIGGGQMEGQPEGVDSLNVSVTGGILLWYLLQGTTR